MNYWGLVSIFLRFLVVLADLRFEAFYLLTVQFVNAYEGQKGFQTTGMGEKR